MFEPDQGRRAAMHKLRVARLQHLQGTLNPQHFLVRLPRAPKQSCLLCSSCRALAVASCPWLPVCMSCSASLCTPALARTASIAWCLGSAVLEHADLHAG